VTVNTLIKPERTAFTIALGDSAEPVAWPHGANVKSPASYFLTVHGTTAELLDAAGKAVTPAPTATVDLARRQFDVRVPDAAWDPGTDTVRITAGVGLWDVEGKGYLQPGPTATATAPGGAAPSNAALFNVAFRTNEALPHIYDPGNSNTIVEGHAGVIQDAAYWRERRQADQLAAGDVSSFGAEVDFGKLARGVDDDSQIPTTGHFDRIFPSRFVFGQGIDYTADCITGMANPCTGRHVGQLQPYALYVPHKPVPKEGFGLVVSMHGLSANYNEFLGSHEAEQLGERGKGSIFASPEGRGPDGSYEDYAEADVFEMWNDVARHYALNPDISNVTGYSMGGGGTYRLASRWPDLWGRAFPIVGPPTSADTFASLRNVPVMAWYCQSDELVGPEMSEEAFLNATQAGIRYDHWVFAPCGHITLGNNDEFGPAAAFMGAHTVERDPAHVTYFFDPGQDPKGLSPTDHAYWISGITLAEGASTGSVDARSKGFGRGDAPVERPAPSAGTLNGGSHGSLPYTRRTQAWGEAPAEAKANEIDVTTTGIRELTINAPRAGVGCDAKVNVTSDVPLKVNLDCTKAASAPVPAASGGGAAACAKRKVTIRLARRIGGKRVKSVRIRVAKRKARTVHGRRARVSFKGVKAKRARVRIVYRLAGGKVVRHSRAYRTCRLA
jgi:pimeloyl-ACP methyl ester carboxylesterase